MKLQDQGLIKAHTFPRTGYPYKTRKTYPLIRKYGHSYELVSLCYYTSKDDHQITSISKFIRYDEHKQAFVSCNFSANEKTRLILPIDLEEPTVCSGDDVNWDKFYRDENTLYKYSDLSLEGLTQHNLSSSVAKRYLNALENSEYSSLLKVYRTLFAETYEEIAFCANT